MQVYNILQKYYVKYLLAITAIVGGYFALFLFDNITNHQHHTTCVFKLITTVPCPGCGMGRATIELFNGNILNSFNYNILCIPVTIAIAYSLIWLIKDLVTKKETFFAFIKQKPKTIYLVLILISILFSWVINIIRGI